MRNSPYSRDDLEVEADGAFGSIADAIDEELGELKKAIPNEADYRVVLRAVLNELAQYVRTLKEELASREPR